MSNSFCVKIDRPVRRTLGEIVHSANAIVRPIDSLIFAAKNDCIPSPIFFVGPPRSGSTLAYQVLAHSLKVTYLPRILDYAYGGTHVIFRIFRKRLGHYNSEFKSRYGKTSGLWSPSEAFGHWRKWIDVNEVEGQNILASLSTKGASDLQRHVYQIQGQLGYPLLVKSLYLSFAILALSKAVPNARFIFLKRDVISNCASIIRARQAHATRTWWSIRPPGYRLHLNEPVADQVVWQLSEIIRIVRTSLELLPRDRWKTVCFEELCANPGETVDGLTSWLENCGVERRPESCLPNSFRLPEFPCSAMKQRIQQSPYFDNLLLAQKCV